MSYTLKLSLPTVPRGVEVLVPGIGQLKNGYSHKIEEEQADAFRVAGSTQKVDIDKDGNYKITDVVGPTLLEAYKSADGFEVTKDDDEPASKLVVQTVKDQPVNDNKKLGGKD